MFFGFATQATAQTISVEVRSIQASTKGENFDTRLSDLKTKLKRGFAGYSSFTLISNQTFNLEAKTDKDVILPNKTTVNLNFFGVSGKLIRLGLKIAKKMNTTLRVSTNSTFFHAGLKYNNDILVVAITVKQQE